MKQVAGKEILAVAPAYERARWDGNKLVNADCGNIANGAADVEIHGARYAR